MLQYLSNIGASLGPWFYVLAGALAFGESALLLGMFLPGETMLLVAGLLASRGVLSLWWLIPIAVIAAIAGDSLGFEIGRRFGPRIRTSRVGRRVGERRWLRADAFLDQHGGRAVLIARLTAVLRALTPTIAGMSGMRYRTFWVWNAIGGIVWGGGCVLLGWAFGTALSTVGHYLTWAPLALVATLVLVLYVRHRRRSRRESLARPAGTGEDRTPVPAGV
jgi:membrane protein DedA with SNARE-associated domain